MSVLAAAAIIVLFLILGLLVGWTAVATRKNNVGLSNSVLIPFSAFLNGGPGRLVKKDGTDQISCPAGTKINIVGAYYDVYDPYGQCSSSPADAVKDCDPANSPLCDNTDAATGANDVCKPGGVGDCRLRDATAYLGRQCNGKEGACAVTLNNEFFGPDPCNSLEIGSDDYQKLPALSGAPGAQAGSGYYIHGIYACVAA